MGLDCTAFESAVLIEDHRHDAKDEDHFYDLCYDAGHRKAYLPSKSFAQSFRGLVEDAYYDISGGESFGWRAGSYSGYSVFRNALAEIAIGVPAESQMPGEDPLDASYRRSWPYAQAVWDDTDRFRDAPFFELINFSDCDGTIGPEACADLARDFEEQYAKFEKAWASVPEGTEGPEGWAPYHWQVYQDWLRACRLAADTGMISFH